MKGLTHKERILECIFKKNFVGTILFNKAVLPEKISLFDGSCDVSIKHENDKISIVTMDFGDFTYKYKLIFDNYSDSGQYIIKCAEII